jgi:hypothetical protein
MGRIKSFSTVVKASKAVKSKFKDLELPKEERINVVLSAGLKWMKVASEGGNTTGTFGQIVAGLVI